MIERIIIAAVAIAGIIALLVSGVGQARSQGAGIAPGYCAPWPALKEAFEKNYSEVPIGGGQVDGTIVVRVLAAPSGVTWSIVTIRTDGTACLAAAGSGWEPGTLPVKEVRL
jgi:hypothetical protein